MSQKERQSRILTRDNDPQLAMQMEQMEQQRQAQFAMSQYIIDKHSECASRCLASMLHSINLAGVTDAQLSHIADLAYDASGHLMAKYGYKVAPKQATPPAANGNQQS